MSKTSSNDPTGTDPSTTRNPDASTGSDSFTEPGFTEPGADREPTPDEEAAAERAAHGVDIDAVAEHYQDAAETGANVNGEGQIEPGN